MRPLRSHARFVLITLIVCAMASPACLHGQTARASADAPTSRAHADSAAVAVSLRQFLTAFENLDWPPFRAAFSDSATIFQPTGGVSDRVTGPLGVDSTFRAIFAGIRASATGGPPYHKLVPSDLRIEPLSAGLVLVTFHLRNAERVARRTIIFRQEGSAWRILHLHGSNVPMKPVTRLQ